MMGPSHSIMAFLTSGAQGEPVDAMNFSEDRSYFSRTAAGSLSRRTYMMGTI
ncbi:hypothetical protein D3C79_963380 [compost metagenome]